MGKKGGVGHGSNKKPPLTSGLLHHGKSQPTSIREQSGRGRGAPSSAQALVASNQAPALRADHLLRIATWASANVPPLGALLGARLGCLCEAAVVPVPDTPHSICERCESVMQIGINCSVRLTKNKRKGKARNISNFVTYICHFCKHGNTKLGTAKNHLKTKIAQAAARSSLKLLGKAEIRSVGKALNFKEENEQRPAKEKKSVGIQQGFTEQNGPEALELTLTKGPPEGFAEQEGSEGLEASLDNGSLNLMETLSQQELVGQDVAEAVEINWPLHLDVINKHGFGGEEGAKAVEMTPEMEPLDSMQLNKIECGVQEVERTSEVPLHKEPLEVNQPEEVSAVAVESILDHGPSDLMEMDTQGVSQQEDPKSLEIDLSKGHVEQSEKNEKGSADPEGPVIVHGNLGKGPLDRSRTSELDEQDGLQSTGMGPKRMPLDLSSKKKRKKKKNQQNVVEQDRPNMSPHKGLASQSRGSAKKRKRQGWSTVKEMLSIP